MFIVGKLYKFNGPTTFTQNGIIMDWFAPFDMGDLVLCIEALEKTSMFGTPIYKLLSSKETFDIDGFYSRFFTVIA